MEYKKGYKIKPYSIDRNGVVRFTDGTEITLIANEKTCKAYGYKYDADRGICKAFDVKENVRNIGKPKDKSRSKNSLILGVNNKLSQNQNTFVTGSNNEVSNRINNSSVIAGSYGKSIHTGEVVIGAGTQVNDDGAIGSWYSSKISLLGATDNNDVDLTVQGNGTEKITLPNNTITIYEVFVSGVCTGGDAGTLGHYCGYKIRGVCKTNKTGVNTASTTTQWNETTGSTGVPSLDFGTNNTLRIIISGATDVSATWSALVNLNINTTTAEI